MPKLIRLDHSVGPPSYVQASTIITINDTGMGGRQPALVTMNNGDMWNTTMTTTEVAAQFDDHHATKEMTDE